MKAFIKIILLLLKYILFYIYIYITVNNISFLKNFKERKKQSND